MTILEEINRYLDELKEKYPKDEQFINDCMTTIRSIDFYRKLKT